MPQPYTNQSVFKSLLHCTSEISLSRNATGREFQRHGPATEKLLSPSCVCVLFVAHVKTSADRSDRRPISVKSWQSSVRYCVAHTHNDPVDNLYERTRVLQAEAAMYSKVWRMTIRLKCRYSYIIHYRPLMPAEIWKKYLIMNWYPATNSVSLLRLVPVAYCYLLLLNDDKQQTSRDLTTSWSDAFEAQLTRREGWRWTSNWCVCC